MAPSTKGTRSTRRQFVGGAAATLAVAGISGCSSCVHKSGPVTTSNKAMSETGKSTTMRMPAVFLPHGGGPWPFVSEAVFGAPGMWDKMGAYMRQLAMVPPARPKAVLVISAHWEARVPTVLSAKAPPMFYDYYGFPKEAYEVTWPAPGQPELAERVRELLAKAKIDSAADGKRGFDHGTFVPLKLSYPKADVPTIQLSLIEGLDPKAHLALGQAIAPLRDEGVFIIGSGMSYHNMQQLLASARGIPTSIKDDSKAFDEWLAQKMTDEAGRREAALVAWQKAPAARACHPREEHLLPLMVVAGTAGNDRATVPYRDVVMGAHVSAVHFTS